MNQGKRGDSLLVRNARLWPHAAQTQPVCVRIVDGVIREVEAELPSGSARVLDAQGLSLIPDWLMCTCTFAIRVWSARKAGITARRVRCMAA